MAGYFQLVFSTSDDGSSYSTLSDEDENNDERIHWQRTPSPTPPKSPNQVHPRSSSTSTSPTENTTVNQKDVSKTQSPPPTPIPQNAFLFFYCLLVLITGCTCRAYLHGILHLIQRTVFATDAELRVMTIAYDIGLIFALLPLCCSSSSLHRPKLLGGGAAFIGFGFLFACIPYFIMRTQLPNNNPEMNDYELCVEPQTEDIHEDSRDTGLVIEYNKMVTNHSVNLTTILTTPPPDVEGAWSTIWLIIAMMLAGVGSAPQFAVGIPYIEDTFRKPSITICMALLLISYFGGIWIGQLASYFMWHHISEGDAETLTRWWLGFFVAAMATFISGLVLFMFRDPGKRQPEVPQEKSGLQNGRNEIPYYKRLRNHTADTEFHDGSLPGRASRLARNIPFIALNFGGALEAAMLTGLLVFVPRYLGSVTRSGLAAAQVFTGSAVIVGVILGTVLGASMIYYRQWSTRKLSKMALVSSVLALCFAWALFFFHCSDPEIIVGVQANDEIIKRSSNLHELLYMANVTPSCDVDCPCSSASITPVCGADDLTYLSPCFAGCTNVVEVNRPDFDGHKSLNFTGCSCVNVTSPPSNTTQYQIGYAMSGVCAVHCSVPWLFWLILCAIYTFAGIQFISHMIVTIRCVVLRDRTAALSILVITWHVLGYIPALIYFSFVLNKSCVLWSHIDNQTYHECAIYDSSSHHLYMCTLVVFLKSFSVVFSAVTFKFTSETEYRTRDRDWVNYDVLEMDSYNGRRTSRTPAYI